MSATTTTKTVLCGNCKGRHPSALDVKACYMGHRVAPTYEPPRMGTETEEIFEGIRKGVGAVAGTVPATPAQISYLARLLGERDHGYDDTEAIVRSCSIDKQAASDEISHLKRCPTKPRPKSCEVAKVAKGEQVPGTDLVRGNIHLVDGFYFRVHVAQGSGKPYACQYVPDTGKFEYASGYVRKLNPGNQVTAEQAAAFGKMTGNCCFCNTAIDTPESTAVGYGPICASKFGLPWG